MRTLLILMLLLGTTLGAAPLRVGVSVKPLESIVQEIAGPDVDVQSLQQEGDSCSVFEPRPSAISWLAEADLFFRIGAGYESSILPKLQKRFTRLEVHDMREAISVLPLEAHAHHNHAPDEPCPAHEEATDPHIWLDPVRLISMTDWITDRLAEARPDQADYFRKRGALFKARASALHKELEALLHPFHGRGFYIYHPALNYFAIRYDLEQVAIAAPNHAPSVKDLHRLITRARDEQVSVIFVQPEESRKHAEIVAQATGAHLVEIDPLGADWETNLRNIGEQLVKSFKVD